MAVIFQQRPCLLRKKEPINTLAVSKCAPQGTLDYSGSRDRLTSGVTLLSRSSRYPGTSLVSRKSFDQSGSDVFFPVTSEDIRAAKVVS